MLSTVCRSTPHLDVLLHGLQPVPQRVQQPRIVQGTVSYHLESTPGKGCVCVCGHDRII